MICTNQACRAEIPADSLFCDQCGGAVGKQSSGAKPSAVETLVKTDAATAFAGRPVQAMDNQVLQLSLSNGSTVALASGDVLGRGEGPLAPVWKAAGLVSDRHGKVENFEGTWSYTDLFSANGSSLNGHFVRPGKAVALQPGDKLVLGNRSCIVL